MSEINLYFAVYFGMLFVFAAISSVGATYVILQDRKNRLVK